MYRHNALAQYRRERACGLAVAEPQLPCASADALLGNVGQSTTQTRKRLANTADFFASIYFVFSCNAISVWSLTMTQKKYYFI